MLLECRLDVIAERDLAWLARLRRSHDSAHDVLSHGESSRDQIDVLPTQCEQLALPHPGLQPHEDHGAKLTFGGGDQTIGFIEIEEVELRLRCVQPLDIRHVLDQAALARDHEHAPEHDEAVVHRLRCQRSRRLELRPQRPARSSS